eukprot:gene1562-1953_t
MGLVIHRCLDFARASHGLGLVPHLEPVALLDALQMPLNCMRDLASHVAFELSVQAEELRREGAAQTLPGSEGSASMLVAAVEDEGQQGSGQGVSSDLFAPLHTRSRKSGGTGLGLFSLAKRCEAL